MSSQSKKTACFACVDAKRRCDRALPSCSRCLDRDIECVYPPVPVRRRAFHNTLINETPRADGAADTAPATTMTSIVSSGSVQQLQDARLDAIRDHRATPISSSTTDLAFTSVSTSSSPPSLSGPAVVGQTAPETPSSACITPLKWFLSPSAWAVAYHYQPPASIPSVSVFSSFIRGLQLWLTRFHDEGHNPFIHRQLYPTDAMPQCMQDAYSAISISQNITHENKYIVDEIASSHITNLLANQSTRGPLSLPILSTRDHLARTQALLIHLLLALFSNSIPRRTRAEGLIKTLLDWTKLLWASTIQDVNALPLFPFMSSLGSDDGVDSASSLYQSFVLSESIRRTWLLCNLTTGVYYSLRGDTASACGGDICITSRAGLWDASSPARWEAIARGTDPLFIYSLHGQSLPVRGIPAAEVDEFARHLFTVLWGIEKVEDWVVRTGDVVSLLH